MPYLLKVLNGKEKGSIYKLEHGMRIGRGPVEIVLTDVKISSQHAIVEEGEEGRVYLKDLDSANGLFVGQKRMKRIELGDGMQIELGRTLCVLYFMEDS